MMLTIHARVISISMTCKLFKAMSHFICEIILNQGTFTFQLCLL